MCGIVGYVGNKNATQVLINALKKLEYRGYDSAGIAVLEGEDILVRKCKGAQWIGMDYGTVLVHIFLPERRAF